MTLTRLRSVLTRGAPSALLLVVAAMASPSTVARDGRPPVVVPDDPSTVIERLPPGYATLATPSEPGEDTRGAIGRVQAAERLLAVAATSGDSRLAARAAGLLNQPGLPETARVLTARAYAAQHLHDFAGAGRLLDRVVQLAPRDGNARLARAQLHLVRGDLDRARTDCLALALGIDASDGLLCVAALDLRRGRYPQAGKTLSRWLQQASDDDPRRRYALAMRAEVGARSGSPDAESWYRKALQAAPGDTEILLGLARHLNRAGRFQAVVDLPGTDASEALAMQRTVALTRLGHPAAARSLAQASARYEAARNAGLAPEFRDLALLYLLLDRPDAALREAKRNFMDQRDYEDVSILLEAAEAADDRETIRSTLAWAESRGIRVPTEGARE